MISQILLLVITCSICVILAIYLINGLIDLDNDFYLLLKIIALLSWNILLTNIVSIINAIFYRELNNHKVVKISISTWLISFLAGLFAVKYLNPLNALIFLSLFKNFIRMIISIYYSGIKIKLGKNFNYFYEFFNFGIPLTISKNVSFLNKRAPQFFCGYFLGPYELGLLSASFLLIDYVHKLFTTTTQSIWIPSLSKISRDKSLPFYKIYLLIRKIQFSLVLPIFVFIYAIRNELIENILPEKFLNIGQFLPYCLLIGIIISTNYLFNPLLISKSLTKILLYFSTLKLILSIISFTIFSSMGLDYIIYLLLIIETLYVSASTFFIKRFLQLSLYKQISDLFPVIIQTFISFVFLMNVKFLIKDLFSLIIILATYISVYVFSIYLVDKNQFIKYKQLIKLFQIQ